MKVFFAPHNDDETLFGAFTLLREHPHVVVVLRSVNQERAYGITAERRELETAEAMEHLGCTWEQWDIPNDSPNWEDVRQRMYGLLSQGYEYAYAPCATEPFAHAQHIRVGELALATFGSALVTQYMTYAEHAPYYRTRGVEVPVLNPFWVKQKLLALSAYQSQIVAPDGYQHFLNDQREFYFS